MRDIKLRAALVLAGLAGIGIAVLPGQAQAWWRYGVGVVVPPLVVAPPPVYVPPPVYYPPPPVYYAPPPTYYAPPRRTWVPPHWEGQYWVPGRWY